MGSLGNGKEELREAPFNVNAYKAIAVDSGFPLQDTVPSRAEIS